MKFRLFGYGSLVFIEIGRNVGLHLLMYPSEWFVFGIVKKPKWGMNFICGGPLFQITIVES